MSAKTFLLAACGLILVASAACAPPYVPARLPSAPPPDNAKVTRETSYLRAYDGTPLFTQAWIPRGPERGVLALVHGLKDHSDRYDAFAEMLAERGIAVHAVDLRGHGRSAGVRVLARSFDEYLDDLDVFMDHVEERAGKRKVFLFGHSMGGAIVTLWTIKRPERRKELSGLLLSGAALEVDAGGLVKGSTRVIGLLWPDAGLFQLDLDKFSRDKAVVAAGEDDPFVYQPGAPIRTAAQLIGAIDEIDAHMEDVTVPLLAMHGGGDVVTPPAGSRDLVARAQTSDKTLVVYDGLYHDLLHEPEHARVEGDIATWLDKHL